MKAIINGKYPKILLTVIGCLLVLYAWAMLWIEPEGVRHWVRLEAQHRQLVEENRQLAEKNQQMRVRIERLKSDPALIETIARRELGMTMPNETTIDLARSVPPPGPAH